MLMGFVISSETTCSEENPFAVNPQIESDAPAITASQTPSASSERAVASARAPDEHAVEIAYAGPSSCSRSATKL